MITEILTEIGLPFAYHHFAEGESPNLPFIIYYSPGESIVYADNSVYESFSQINIELYTEIKSPETEKMVEEIFKRNGIVYSKNETYIDTEKMYQILYETEVQHE